MQLFKFKLYLRLKHWSVYQILHKQKKIVSICIRSIVFSNQCGLYSYQNYHLLIFCPLDTFEATVQSRLWWYVLFAASRGGSVEHSWDFNTIIDSVTQPLHRSGIYCSLNTNPQNIYSLQRCACCICMNKQLPRCCGCLLPHRLTEWMKIPSWKQGWSLTAGLQVEEDLVTHTSCPLPF